MKLSTPSLDWVYATHKPTASATFKAYPTDFQVIEQLGYEPSGEGEHVFVKVEKTNLNTAFVAESLAKFLRLPLRQVTYAGRKDKYAQCEQTFGVHLPGNEMPDFTNWQLDGIRVIDAKRHHKKLRTGQLAGNRFVITLRNVTDSAAVIEALQHIAHSGVPNYYGEQRFGTLRKGEGATSVGGNLALGFRQLEGETIRNRNKRSMALSALRSYFFNQCVSARVKEFGLHTLLAGDALQLAGNNSFFIADDIDTTLQQRFEQRDLAPTAPLWGSGALPTQTVASQFEQTIAQENSVLCQFLTQQGLKMERRPLILWAQQLEWQSNSDTLTVSFVLPSGCFATTIMRECVQLEEVDEPQSTD